MGFHRGSALCVQIAVISAAPWHRGDNALGSNDDRSLRGAPWRYQAFEAGGEAWLWPRRGYGKSPEMVIGDANHDCPRLHTEDR
jgi:hypothetical protein